jgi:hypothetical protein
MLHNSEYTSSRVSEDDDIDSNPLNLRPDPVVFVSFVTSIGDSDISSEIFVKLLEGYRKAKEEAKEEDDPRG